MKQLAQYQNGRIEVQEVPDPAAPPGGILVRVTHSVISPGTERMKVEQARMNLLQKARARPDQVRKVLHTAKTLGWKAAMEKVRNRLESPSPLGYSAAGIVVAVDEANTRFHKGDRVACGGAECAHHAELISVPDLLAAAVPENVPLEHAAHTTLCAIAMHAARQSGLALGEQAWVAGQGLIGQLVTGVLNAGGVRVLASDLSDHRLAISRAMGAERALNPGKSSIEDSAREWAGGRGVDAVLLCVGGDSGSLVRQALQCLRDRGTLVIVGITDVSLDWKAAYEKEIQVRYARSYGPGRYDPEYEWAGHDYPPGHVRWTENRNFDACLRLMAEGRLRIDSLITHRVSLPGALEAYSSMVHGGGGHVSIVIRYEPEAGATVEPSIAAGELAARASDSDDGASLQQRLHSPVTNLHVIGAGNFARSMLLPHLKGKIELGTVVNATGLSARHVRAKFGFADASTDLAKIEGSGDGAVLVATRHHLHAALAGRFLGQDRHVFVEKPLCLSKEELAGLSDVIEKTRGSLMVGFNRRFAPAAAAMRDLLRATPGPKSISYHVFAGPLPPDHWYANVAESGGRVAGECCHFFDFCNFLVGASAVRVFAQRTWPLAGASPAPDSIAAQVSYADGSSAQLICSAEGDFSVPKETIRVFGAGIVLDCENFQRLTIHRGMKTVTRRFSSKGHEEEIIAWLGFLREGKAHPLPGREAVASMALTFAALDSIRENNVVRLA